MNGTEKDRMRRARALHDAMTGVPAVWDDLDDDELRAWFSTLDEFDRLCDGLSGSSCTCDDG